MRPLVLDAAAVVDLLLNNDQGKAVRRHLPGADLFSVAHLDAEVFSALGRLHRNDELSVDDVAARLHLLHSLAIDRMSITENLTLAAWAMRDNVALRDGLYVAAARALGGAVLTSDAKLRRAVPGYTVNPHS